VLKYSKTISYCWNLKDKRDSRQCGARKDSMLFLVEAGFSETLVVKMKKRCLEDTVFQIL
jgi:hypothetical protein